MGHKGKGGGLPFGRTRCTDPPGEGGAVEEPTGPQRPQSKGLEGRGRLGEQARPGLETAPRMRESCAETCENCVSTLSARESCLASKPPSRASKASTRAWIGPANGVSAFLNVSKDSAAWAFRRVLVREEVGGSKARSTSQGRPAESRGNSNKGGS